MMGGLVSQPVFAEGCAYPFPRTNIPVVEYIKQLQGSPKGGLAEELGSAIFDLVEWTPTSCGDVPPEVTYKSFIIRRAAAEGAACRTFRIGIVPPGASPEREEMPVTCTPAKDGSVNGWVCFFRK